VAQTDTLKSSVSGFEEARRQVSAELVSGVSGFLLAMFMCGHVLLVGSILTGTKGFDWVAVQLEEYFIAQPTVVAIFFLFFLHAAFAARKIPAKLRERREMLALAKGLWKPVYEAAEGHAKSPLNSFHLDSQLWIWQVRTGMVILVLGGFHIILIGIDVMTPLFGDRPGIEAATTLARERAGLWILYSVLMVCVSFHTATGLYRLAIKWGSGGRLSRRTLAFIEHVILWTMLGLGSITLAVMAGLIAPPLAGLIGSAP
jgi:succinate dehydrogenase/fumarate reductase cytochrome b subunit